MGGLVAAYWPQLSVVIRVAIGMLLGAALGLEREAKHKPAGLRTHMLMAGAASVLVALGPLMVEHLSSVISAAALRADPISLIGAVITGVSFLGAGTIIRGASGEQVEGLTTAASLLLAAAIGISTALDLWVLAVGVTLLALIVLRGGSAVERVLHRD
jgi:putative Mg2+ transporter-C (MgtC) family protein